MPRLSQSYVDKCQRDLFSLEKSHFKVTARVDLSRLVFDQNFRRMMDGHDNTNQLEKIMKIKGCQRLRTDCHVPVLVSVQDWENRMRIRADAGFLPTLEVDMDCKLHAQDHESLITAARKRLGPNNQWWIVDVYVADEHSVDDSAAGHNQISRLLQERLPIDNRPPDGLIYERIRYYEGHLGGPIDKMAARDWWAILEKAPGHKRSNKGRYLRYFFKHPTLPAKLDALIPISGIWEGMQIGSLHKLIGMRCDEPITCYWELIYETFLGLVGGKHELLRQIDGATVLLLQSRAPGVSSRDLQFLETHMENGNLFREIHEEELRRGIWERLRVIDHPIPTLRTFFKDRLYLEVGQSVMRRLCVFDSERRTTIDEGVVEQYDTSVQIVIPHLQEMLKPDLYELWRFSFQYGFELTDHRRLVGQKRTVAQPSVQTHVDPDIWQAFLQLVVQRRIKPPVGHAVLEASPELPPLVPCDYPVEASEEIPVAHRCGKPFVDSAAADRFALSAESLNGPWSASRVTAGFVRKSFFHAFFRYLKPSPNDPICDENVPGEMATETRRETSDEQPPTDLSLSSSTLANTPSEPVRFYPLSDVPQTLQPDFLTSVQPSSFHMDLSICDNHYSLDLPNSPEIFNPFSEELSQHHFYVNAPSDNRSLERSQYYWYYTNHPGVRLQAEFVAPDSFVAHSQGLQYKKRKLLGGSEEQARAEEWLQRQVARFSPAPPPVTPGATNQTLFHEDADMEEL